MSAPVGSRVLVVTDNKKSIIESFTRCDPWVLKSGEPVVLIQGLVGAYSMDRVYWRGAYNE